VPEECEIIAKYYKRNNMSTITLQLLQQICPKTKPAMLEKYVTPLNEVCQYYEIDTPKRIAGFLAQTAHESGGFQAVKENLNYSAKGLMTTFKKYFPTEDLAKEYERQPAKIANKVYGNRMGNGDEASGDGNRYCGRGLIQLTGKQNYTRFAADLGISVEECVAYMETPAGAVSSAGWFFDQNNLLPYCDSGDIKMLTKRINGGTIGLDDRIKHYNHALAVLSS
jgi:putative chitinase